MKEINLLRFIIFKVFFSTLRFTISNNSLIVPAEPTWPSFIAIPKSLQ